MKFSEWRKMKKSEMIEWILVCGLQKPESGIFEGEEE